MNKPVLIGLNKVDIVRRDELKQEKMEQLKRLEDDSTSMFELSTVTQKGVMDFRNTVFFFFVSLLHFYCIEVFYSIKIVQR